MRTYKLKTSHLSGKPADVRFKCYWKADRIRSQLLDVWLMPSFRNTGSSLRKVGLIVVVFVVLVVVFLTGSGSDRRQTTPEASSSKTCNGDHTGIHLL